MPSFKPTKDLMHFMEVLKERKQEKGDQVGTNFKNNCLTKVAPECSMTKMWITDLEWKFVPEPEGGAPKDPEESFEAITEEKDNYYREWAERIQGGDFDSETVPAGDRTDSDTDNSVSDEEVNMSDLANDQPQSEVSETETSTSEEEEQEKKRIAESIAKAEAHDQRLKEEQEQQRLEEGGVAKEEPEPDELGDRLLTVMGLYIRKHSPTQEMVSNAVSDRRLDAMASVIKTQAEKIKALEESIPAMVDEHLKAKFN